MKRVIILVITLILVYFTICMRNHRIIQTVHGVGYEGIVNTFLYCCGK
jgi:hypothetical protein